jgi:DNA-directed RNA polymerase specialized sigma24 family protein
VGSMTVAEMAELSRDFVAVQCGDVAAFARFWPKVAPRTAGPLRLFRKDAREDLLAEAAVIVWTTAPTCKRPERPIAWIRGIIGNLARKRWTAGRLVLLDPEWFDRAASGGQLDLEDRLDVQRAMQALGYDACALLMEIHGSDEEAAEALGISVGAVKARKQRAREQARKLANRGRRTPPRDER